MPHSRNPARVPPCLSRSLLYGLRHAHTRRQRRAGRARGTASASSGSQRRSKGIRSDSGIYPTVEAYVLLGVVADHAGVGRFANAPHLLKIHAITSADVSAMRRRCAKLRYALQRAGGCIHGYSELILT